MLNAWCWYFNTDVLDGENFYNAYLKILSEERKRKIDSLANIQDKKLSLGVGLIAEYLLKTENLSVNDLLFDQKGKPFVKDNRFYLSLSHSGKYAVGVKCFLPVGVDVEKIRPLKSEVFKKYFSKEEIEFANYTDDGFFKVWTQKESLVKKIGKNVLEIPKLSTIDAQAQFDTITVDDHVFSVCTEKGHKIIWEEYFI